jgi:hypothetical protein
VIRAIVLRLLFVLGALLGIAVAIVVFFRSLLRRARAFHPSGTVCDAELVALDDTIGPRLAGPARVRLSGSSEPEGSPAQTILGMAIEIGGDQDLPLATFESFLHASEATAQTNVADYLANQYSSVTPWRVGRDTVWFRAIPAMPPAATTGTRVDRLDAAIAAGRATFTLETRHAPGPDGALRARIAELRLTARRPADDPRFKISMLRTARGLVPTGLRNGVRLIAYPASQLGRRLRGA